MQEEKTAASQTEEALLWETPNIGKDAPDQFAEASAFCEGYKAFLDAGKTERECVRTAVGLLDAAGYRPLEKNRRYAPGDKIYFVNRGKSIIMTTFGLQPLCMGIRLNGAHIDSPRLDLKPNPLYEKDELAYFKTHYYGGIRKYQWGTIPLAVHGVVYKKDGTAAEIRIGEEPGDPVFCISDLLPHLSARQDARKLSDGLRGEELNIIVGSLPVPDASVGKAFKLYVMRILNGRYGITEKDFYRAELEMVPAQKAVDVGFDRSMVGAYGQDDRVCAYTALMAEIATKSPAHTTVTVLTDKEEIGSEGPTGMNSSYLLDYIGHLAGQAGANTAEVLANSICLSSDVNAGYDPTFADAYELNNSARFNRGCVLTKYTGSRGKSGANDAGAETMAKVIGIMEENGVYWQAGEIGAVDVGGGGTIAKFISRLNVDTVDLGVPVLSMHAPFELTAKLDVLNAYRAFLAFYR